MQFAIFDSTGNLVESFDSEDEARTALSAITDRNPDAADRIAIFTFDDNGDVVGDAITIADADTYGVIRSYQ
jgi:hypothetical protein